MNAKQRTKMALRKGKPDRPPLGFFAIDCDTAEKILGRETYWRAKAKCTIAFWEGRRQEVVQSLIEDGKELYQKLDIIDIISTFTARVPPVGYQPQSPKKLQDDTWEDRQGRIFKYSPITQDIVMVFDPQQFTREIDFAGEMWDGRIDIPDMSQFEVIDALTTFFGGERYILGDCAPPVSGWVLPGGMERGLMEIALHPKEVKELFESLMEKAIAHNHYYYRPGQDGVLLGDDYACTKGPFVNPQTYRELFLESHCKRIKSVKDDGFDVVNHSCGNNWSYLDIFADMGFDCYQSIQTSASMDIGRIQREYGDKFAVWGGVQVESLIGGTPEDIRKEVQDFMQHIAPQGGCILGTSHSVAVGTKYDNFVAMLDEFSKWI